MCACFESDKTMSEDEKHKNDKKLIHFLNFEIKMILIGHRAQSLSLAGESTPGKMAATSFSAASPTGALSLSTAWGRLAG